MKIQQSLVSTRLDIDERDDHYLALPRAYPVGSDRATVRYWRWVDEIAVGGGSTAVVAAEVDGLHAERRGWAWSGGDTAGAEWGWLVIGEVRHAGGKVTR